MQDNTNIPPPAGRRAFSFPNQDKSLCLFLHHHLERGARIQVLLIGVTPRAENTDTKKPFWKHLLVLLGEEAQVEARFGLFRGSANLDAR